MIRLRMSLSGKLIAAFLAVAAVQFVFCAYSIHQLRAVGGYFDTAYEDAFLPHEHWLEFRLAVGNAKALVSRHIAEDDPDLQEAIAEEVEKELEITHETLHKLIPWELSDAQRERLKAEDLAGVDHRDINFSKEPTDELLALLLCEHDCLEPLLYEVLRKSEDYLKEDALILLNESEGAESFQVIDSVVSTMTDRSNAVVVAARNKSHALRDAVIKELIGGGVLTVLLAMLIGLLISRGVSRPIGELDGVFKRLAVGERVEKVVVVKRDEIGRLLESMNLIIDSNQTIIEQANTIAQGDYSTQVKPRGNQDELGIALNRMSDNLREVSGKNERESWIKTGQAELSDIMRGELDLPTLSKNVICYLAKYVGASVGVLYLADEDKTLRLTGSYAFTQRKRLADSVQPGEGLIGQAAMERESISISHVPRDYITVSSGLGEAVPRYLLAVPITMGNQLKGVMELGAFKPFTKAQRELLDRTIEHIAIAVNSAQDRGVLNQLLQDSQTQAEELRAQQEELRAANEEMEEHTRALKKSEEKLQTQSEELRTTNEELEEKSEYLTRQKDGIEKQNHELEIAQRELASKASDLEMASKYKSEFLANMSHELRTPLNSLLILSKSLSANEEGNLNDDQLRSAQVIHDGGRDLLRLINDILDLSKVEAGKLHVHMEAVTIRSLTDRLDTQFSHIAREKGLRFEIEIDDDLPRGFNTDAQRVEQVLRNLLSNAFKFTSTGSVDLRVQRAAAGTRFHDEQLASQGVVAISVADTGIGIPADRQEAIFEAFQQCDGSTSRSYGGTGLGLAISRELTRLLGGEIHLSSKTGEGSTFTLYLPLADDAVSTGITVVRNESSAKVVSITPSSNPHTAPEAPGEPSTSIPEFLPDDRRQIVPGDRTCLIIEDDRLFAQTLLKLSRKRGYRCLAAGDGSSGLQLAQRYKPSSILLDLGLPDIDGLAVLEQLKENLQTRHIPVHVISGSDSIRPSLNKGAIGHLRKPAEAEDVDAAFAKMESLLCDDVRAVLLVEDNDVLRDELVRLIDRGGIEITSVATGQEACQAVLETEFGCVVLDLGLPDMTGFDLLKKFHGTLSEKTPPVIIYTGRELTRQEHVELKQYADCIVIKGAESVDRVLDEVSLFLHSVESTLPREQRQRIRMLHDPNQTLAGRKILLVDDDMRNTFALSKELQKVGMEVVMADNGKLALEKLESDQDIQLVVMDIMMPVMDGYEAMRAIRAQEKFEKLPIIAITAKAMPEDRAKCLEAGANDYLTKPVDIDQLMSLLRVWLFSQDPVAT